MVPVGPAAVGVGWIVIGGVPSRSASRQVRVRIAGAAWSLSAGAAIRTLTLEGTRLPMLHANRDRGGGCGARFASRRKPGFDALRDGTPPMTVDVDPDRGRADRPLDASCDSDHHPRVPSVA